MSVVSVKMCMHMHTRALPQVQGDFLLLFSLLHTARFHLLLSLLERRGTCGGALIASATAASTLLLCELRGGERLTVILNGSGKIIIVK